LGLDLPVARAEITVTGTVQGVGFRPFVFRLAKRFGLVGIVRNLGDAGVEIVVEGDKKPIEDFTLALGSEQPPFARIEDVKISWKQASGEFSAFNVVESEKRGSGERSVLPPDLALCDDCLNEMLNPVDRRHLYPFITCVNCGPRFTIVEELPYDRARTSMKEFPLCADCLREYTDPSDRRYHAEPTCCPVCGPRLELFDANGDRIDGNNLTLEVARLLDKGDIVAIKGIGGTHLAAKTTDDEVLTRLRRTFNRPQQPFAIMSKDLKTARTFADVDEVEAGLLTSYRRPIVVLNKSSSHTLSELVSPGIDSVGVMLPYSGIHHLILGYGRDPAYVMTSANVPGMPMLIDNDEAIAKLRGSVDYFLLHNRRIVSRCDDSVVKTIGGRPTFLRRSRGWVPEPLKLSFRSGVSVLALGGELNATVALLVNDRCFISQHIGDTTKFETLRYLQEAAKHMLHMLNLDHVDIVAHDLHPGYATTRIAPEVADELGAKPVQVQHHHAHLSKLLAEQGLEDFVGIAADGIGFGSDGTAWGGEVMVVDMGSFERVGGLMSQPMPGGDLATRFPSRMVAGILSGAIDIAELEQTLKDFCSSGFRQGDLEIKVVLRQLERGLNVFRTSSCGRVLDAVSCLLGLCCERTYEGEPAIKLEAAAGRDSGDFRLKSMIKNVNGLEVLDTSKFLLDVLGALREGVSRKRIAAASQRALAQGLAEIAIDVALARGIKMVGGSGGVFYNRSITSAVRKSVEEAGLKFVQHELLPPGDGGISVGQAVVAAHRESAPARL
jgi:hydrogenase maturation protein HypF